MALFTTLRFTAVKLAALPFAFDDLSFVLGESLEDVAMAGVVG